MWIFLRSWQLNDGKCVFFALWEIFAICFVVLQNFLFLCLSENCNPSSSIYAVNDIYEYVQIWDALNNDHAWQLALSFGKFFKIFFISGLQQSSGLVGAGCADVWDGSWLPTIFCRPAYPDIWENSVWKGKSNSCNCKLIFHLVNWF